MPTCMQIVGILLDPVIVKLRGSEGTEPRRVALDDAKTYMREESECWQKVIHSAELRIE